MLCTYIKYYGSGWMKIIHEVIECIREIIRYVSASPSQIQGFNEIAQYMLLPIKKGLNLDVAIK